MGTTFEELKCKAHALPLSPGVYIMRNKNDDVIYVGKAKQLRNRVSQYFVDTVSHSPKTVLMVSNIHHFDVIVAASEFEALVLECSLIKRHKPKFNILLKDDKGYPYIRLQMRDEYPKLELAAKHNPDGALYFGPYGSRGVTQNIIKTIRQCLKLPSCSKQFPKDIGKGRVCLHYHMNQCEGWCQKNTDPDEYRKTIAQARLLLEGKYKSVTESVRQQMEQAAEELNFELAAKFRDQLRSVEALSSRQTVTAGRVLDMDVIGYAQTETKACFAVLHYSDGALTDKDYEVFPVPDSPESAVSQLLKQYYLGSNFVPKCIFLPFPIEDADILAQLLKENYGGKVSFRVPHRGENLQLVKLAVKNAQEEAQRLTSADEKISGTVNLLKKMLSIPEIHRIESFDISHISGTDIVASMVVFIDGKPKKSEYKRFKIQDLDNQDDYASMRQVIYRRMRNYMDATSGFTDLPDVMLIDGGVQHAKTALEVLQEFGVCVNVFGMVKDDRHRTRALVTPDGEVISIAAQQSVFAFIGNIQEQTHGFAINYHKKLRSKRLKYSALDNIPGIGPKRKEELLKRYKSLTAIAATPLSDLERILPKDAALAVYKHFNSGNEE